MQDRRIETRTEMVLGQERADPVVLIDPGPAASEAMFRQSRPAMPEESPAGEDVVVDSFLVAGVRHEIHAERRRPAG